MLFSASAQSINSSPKVFYPLPSLAEGKNIAAKNLFHGGDGGIWLQDVRNQILFFDGEHIMPSLGSALEHEAEQLAFVDNAFWTFFRNELYRTVPNQEKQLMLSLTPGIEIQSIGASQRFIWLSDQDYFYTYHIDTEQLEQYSLAELYQYNQSSTISINDAKFIYSKWVLATSSGVFLSDQQTFQHVASSGKNYVETLYFSSSRDELVIGTLSGALVFDIYQPSQPVKQISSGHVLSIAETDQEYWIGTEFGLFVYSFAIDETSRFEQGFWAGNDLGGEKIYALLNDQHGGMWIATDRGVRYFSTFSRHFVRYDNWRASYRRSSEAAIKIEPSLARDGYWMLTHQGLYRMRANAFERRELIYRGEVNDFEQGDGVLWLATKQGIVCIDAQTGEVINDDLPNSLKQTDVRFIELDPQGLLWGAGDNQLWSYHLSSQRYTSFGSEWMIDQYLPAKLTHLSLTNQGYLALGTDHGIYLLQEGQVRFVGESVNYGEVVDIEPVSEQELWVASRYGAYQLDIVRQQTQPLTMVDGHVTPKCILNNEYGVWLTSSSGLSRYANSGQLLAHYGEPLGLINNEFVAGLCGYSSDNQTQLVLGARDSFIEIDTERLSKAPLPKVEVIFSQIKRNQRMFSLGNTISQALSANYGDSLFFQFGTIPSSSNLNLEFRLSDDNEWHLLDGSTLSIEHLKAGAYTLEVRAVRNGIERSTIKRFEFLVKEPWYLTPYAVLSYVLLLALILGAIVYWRSRMMASSNRSLRAQVALKTNQLRHQSRILVSNNQQLRKQLQVRRLIYMESIAALGNKLRTRTEPIEQGAEAIDYVIKELELLLNTRSTNGKASPVYNLSLIVQSVTRGWQDELDKAAIHVVIETVSDFYVSLKRFNLDEVFNWVFADIVKRCYRNQTVMIQLQERDGWVIFSMLDQGSPAEKDEADYTEALSSLVEQSGGRLYRHVSNERNLIELSWPNSDAFEEQTTATASSNVGQPQGEDHDPWLEKLVRLVEKQYGDPEFSTSSAAKQLYVSERSLQRRVKSAFDKTFTEYLTDTRLDNACRRLLAGGKVSDVAFECGFNDPSYFSQRFKHRFGLSPTQFVEQQEGF
ncbi:helix-turn-helix domain-containing protein [Vibrio sp. JPW-9-11-11]|uniref:AraC family transcriptional regulator n=1 Tax=Vibrio sp. JPW-9-11-11 TaxID=1416532 RepID=UPI00159394C7|nr:AraC family transcriptional regulator [Vibrio sp. JPW-9-11-11]NVD06168.1 helix-turn-helix domain-containing protein [Vibrio sp. JPW-9-11-11]